MTVYQHPKSRDQDALRLLLSDRAAIPALPQRPLAHVRCKPNDMPDAGARRAANPAQSLHRRVHPPACIDLASLRSGSRPLPGIH